MKKIFAFWVDKLTPSRKAMKFCSCPRSRVGETKLNAEVRSQNEDVKPRSFLLLHSDFILLTCYCGVSADTCPVDICSSFVRSITHCGIAGAPCGILPCVIAQCSIHPLPSS